MVFHETAFNTAVLSNGIRIVHKNTNSQVAHCGIVVNTGSRNEKLNEHGVAHLLEHMAFKGTKNRKAFHISSRIENVGGEIDAYTTKEFTCYYSSFLNRHYDRTIELLADIVFNSTFPENELKKEKQVVYEEINMYDDAPSDLIFDEFEEHFFNKNSIGRSILGTKESVRTLAKADLINFRDSNYLPNRIVLCSVGQFDFNKIVKIAEKYFLKYCNYEQLTNDNKEIIIPSVFNKTVEKQTHQGHCIMGVEAYNLVHPKKHVLSLITNLLGGEATNTRLNQLLREKLGLVYQIEADYSSYTDSGLFEIYFGTDKDNIDKSIGYVYKEVNRLINNRLGVLQLSVAKNQLMGQLAIASENSSSLMLALGRNLLYHNKVYTINEIIKKIEAITAEDILEVSNEVFYNKDFATLIYK